MLPHPVDAFRRLVAQVATVEVSAQTMFVLRRFAPHGNLDSKLRRKVVEILRNYVKISVLRGVCLTFRSPFKWTWNEGRSESNGSSPSMVVAMRRDHQD